MSNLEASVLDWREVKAELDLEVDRIWLDMPIELERIRWGVVPSGAGSGGQYFSVLVHLEAYTMLTGGDIMFRLLKMASYPEAQLPQMVMMTQEFLINTFDCFEFMEDLGLTGMHRIGQRFSAALGSLTSVPEYIELMGAMMTYILRIFRWVHFIFPWNLGVAFPQRTAAEVKAFAAVVGDEAHTA